MTPLLPSSVRCHATDHESLRTYLLFVAEQHLDPDLRAKAGPSDLVHEALLSAHLARRDYRGNTENEYRGWLRTILVRLIHNFRRQFRGTRARCVDREVPLSAAVDPASEDSPSQFVSKSEQRQRLVNAIATLPEEYRRVIGQRFDDDCSFLEIGQRLTGGSRKPGPRIGGFSAGSRGRGACISG